MAQSEAFAEPWEARAFALVRTLRDRGVFSAQEWSDALGEQIARGAGDAVHYGHWLDALEHLLDGKGLARAETLQRYRAAWRHAAERTRHGHPITLTVNDFPTKPEGTCITSTYRSGSSTG